MRYRTPTYLFATVAAALACAGPAAAQDQPPTPSPEALRLYKVTAEGSGTFNRYRELRYDGLGHDGTTTAAFSWKVDTKVVFDWQGNAVILVDPGDGSAPAPAGTITASATDELNVYGSEGVKHQYCEAAEQTQRIEGANLRREPVPHDPANPGAHLIFRPFSGIGLDANCTVPGIRSINIWNEVPSHIFDQQFFLPHEATRQGKIIQLVEASPQQRAACIPADHMKTCQLDWKGTLTFEYLGKYGGDGPIPDEDLVLPIPTDPQPQQPTQPQQPNSDDDLFLPIPLEGKLAANGSSASVTVGCAGACSGTVSAYTAGGTRGAAAKPLAKAKFSTRAGKRKTVKLRFKGAALRKVRKAKALRLVIDTGVAKKTIVVRAKRR